MTGRTEQHLLRTGVRYALGVRTAVAGASSIAALFLVPAREPAVLVAVVLGLNAWNAWFAYRFPRGGRLVPADIAVMCAVCLSQPWTTPAATSAEGTVLWMLAGVAMTVMTYAWLLPPRTYVVATVLLVTAQLAGYAIAAPDRWLSGAPFQLWIVVEAGLSWMLYRMLRRGARNADSLVAQRESARRTAAIADARRSDEREYLAALHDTASATLLMVGNGAVGGRRELAAQASRDLDVISGRIGTASGEVDLVATLREAAAHTPLTVRWQLPERLSVPAVEAAALANGTREALTNVVRHAHVDEASVSLSHNGNHVTVRITDDGVGFDPASLNGDRYGVTRSLVQRMERIGGHAEVISRPGAGTTVTLTCDLTAPEPPSEDAEMIGANLMGRMRWAAVAINLVILLGLDLPKLIANWNVYPSPWTQVLFMAALIAITLVVAWRRTLGRWTWVLAGAVLAISIAAPAAMPAELWHTSAHWSFREAAWTLVVVGIEWRLAALATVLVVQHAVTLVHIGLSDLDGAALPGVVNATVMVLSYQLAVGMIAALMRPIAASAAQAAHEQERLRTADAVSEQLSQDRRDRYAELGRTAAPLLAGLASGDLDPADPAVRRSCATEAARMRRLFAEDSTAPDPLLHELRACIESVEGRGLTVAFAERGDRPAVPERDARTLAEPIVAALATAVSKARVTVVGAGGQVTVSVVADGPDGDLMHVKSSWRGES
ncbi:histidine kinase/DNA gyrase B/HSP90-like ATPase [Herbihabitans rhizosphaerae]|uniref:Histidine kinase/DNA gyrase B/HSP90-like ATPase n=1 Tax=Herbihabitans rhizosphaerae TaxID=1872711 RepID=A0A4Q7KMU7_9PSEU|nr:ATP-binding protein [Herbihabitans rhizosphaerae]RZS37805.1 histidine kinase/DNA gyrase B/HSP90-like ATPase [Herbihabitans rhizosphaerae]